MACVAAFSALVYASAGTGLSFPWIVPDEWIYSELAKSMGSGALPSVRGESTLGYGLVYPAIIAPAWAVFADPADAYVAAKLVDAVVMSLAAFPAFFLARRFVAMRPAMLVAVFSVLIPSMLLSGALLIESALYPIFLLAMLGYVASVQRPTRANQLLAVGGIALACFTKPLSIVLVPAYAMTVLHLALVDRRRGGRVRDRIRAHSLALGLFTALAYLTIVGSAALGNPDAVLGVYGVVLGNIDVSGTLVWFLRHAAGLDLYVAVLPFAATVALIVFSFTASAAERANERIDEFAAIASWTIVGTLAAVAAYSSRPLAGASGYLPSEARLHERNMFELAPVLFIGLALYLERRRPGPRWVQLVALATGVSLPLFLPLGRLLENANFQALAIIPWTADGVAGLWPFTFIPFGMAACAVFLVPSRHADRLAWLFVGVALVVTTISASASMSRPDAAASSAVGVGYDTRWIDHAVPKGAEVLALWVAPDRHADLGTSYRPIWMSEFFNRSVGRVVEVGAPMPYDLPHTTASIRSGILRGSDGAPVESNYLLAPCWVSVAGTVVASDRRARAVVYRLSRRPIRVETPVGRSGCALDAGRLG